MPKAIVATITTPGSVMKAFWCASRSADEELADLAPEPCGVGDNGAEGDIGLPATGTDARVLRRIVPFLLLLERRPERGGIARRFKSANRPNSYASGQDRLPKTVRFCETDLMTVHKDSFQVQRLEVVNTGRRRRWSVAEKLRIVEESFQGHRQVSATACRHDISPSLLFSWRKAFRRGRDEVRPAERVVAFYNQRGTAEQWTKEGKNAIKWTRLSCRSLRNNAVRLQLHALAYNLGNFMRTLALPDAVEQWSLTTLREKLVKIGAKVVSHGRYVTFQLAEVAVTRSLFQKILSLIDDLRRRPAPA